MLTAWMTMGTLGFIVARFLKGMTKEKKLCGKDLWFLVRIHYIYYCMTDVPCCCNLLKNIGLNQGHIVHK